MSLGSRENPYDLVVIGGGINGAGIARDAALRGLSVALFEKNDFSTGATWASSGMIHGGIRYLSKDPEVTRLACYDSGYIQKIAPHLIFRIPFIMPFLQGSARERVVMELAEIYFDTYDRYAPLKGGARHSRLTREEVLAIEPGVRPDILGAVTTDEWGIDSPRLNFINAWDATLKGAHVHNYHEVVAFLRGDGSGSGQPGEVRGVRVRDRIGGQLRDVHARLTFNATGPWSEQVARQVGAKSCRVRPGKGVHLVLAGRATNYAIITEAIDGRQIFICPHQNVSFIGTTDDDYFGDLDNIPVLEDEVKYLLDGVRTVFPSVDRYRIVDTMVGCRPTLHERGNMEDDLSREHAIYDHTHDGAPNLMSMAGGKLASYRVMSEEAVDLVMRRLGREGSCTTHTRALPGGEAHDLSPLAFAEVGVSPYAAGRILYRHGSRAGAILDLLREDPRQAALVDPSEPVTEAELRYVMRHEHVRTLDDCKRRARLGCGLDGGWASTLRAAEIFCEEKGQAWGDRFDVALGFQRARFKDRKPILAAEQLAAEAIGHTWFFLAGGAMAASASALVNPAPATRDHDDAPSPAAPSADEDNRESA